MRLGKTIYCLVLLLVLISGLILIFASSWVHSAVTAERMEELLRGIDRLKPGLSHQEAQQLRTMFLEWRSRLGTESMLVTILRDLGIALLVAVILTVVIESYARWRLQDEIQRGVVEATFRRLIPVLVFDQVKAHVIGAKSVRRSYNVEMHLYRDAAVTAINASYYVSNTVLSYRLYNTTGATHEEPIVSGLDLDVVGQDATGPLPRFESVRIGERVFDNAQRLATLLSPGNFRYQTHHPLPPNTNDYVEVVNSIREIIKVPDTFVWNTTGPTEGARIVVDASGVPEVRVEVMALHPDRNKLIETVTGRTWVFEGGMLPWQGFQIRTYLHQPAGLVAAPAPAEGLPGEAAAP